MGTMLSSEESDAGWSTGGDDDSSTEGNLEDLELVNDTSDNGVRRRQNHKSDDSVPLDLERPKSKKRHKRLAEIFGSAKTLLVLVVLTAILLYYYSSNQNNTFVSDPSLPIRERTKLRTERKSKHKPNNEPGMFANMVQKAADITGIHTSVEDLPRGCERPEWQNLNFQNCNNIHEIDLLSIMTDHNPKTGFIASGLWRGVYAVNNGDELLAMKIMRTKHEVDDRNFDRHRRDALVMERLTSSPYVVDGYGFCGNTVLTEYLTTPLDSLIYSKTYTSEKGGQEPIPAKMRILWAHDVARGVQALHEIDKGPIVHADVQAKQFLISPETGVVKVNDFNRCRFAGQKTGTSIPCKFKIPSAPGKARSPEEYAYKDLDEKLDMYSVGNILYSILTREKHWDSFSTNEAKKKIKQGFIPPIPVNFDAPLKVQQWLVELNKRAYALSPKERISAKELGDELEKLLDTLR